MKAKFILMCCLFTAGLINAHAQTAPAKLTLKTCLETALANNIPVKQSELLEQNAKLNLNQSRMNRLPNVSASINYIINNGRSIDPFTNSYINQQLSSSSSTPSASVPVFKGFQTQNSIQQASYNYQASRWNCSRRKIIFR